MAGSPHSLRSPLAGRRAARRSEETSRGPRRELLPCVDRFRRWSRSQRAACGCRGKVMRRIQKLLSVAAPVVVAVTGLNASAVSAAAPQAPLTMLQWRSEIGQVSAVGSGCFQASFPSLVWHATTCVTAPERPFAPAPAPSRRSGPDTVGNGPTTRPWSRAPSPRRPARLPMSAPRSPRRARSAAQVPRRPTTSRCSSIPQFFSGSPACSGASIPANCQAWQQFVYTTDGNIVFMQYWLIDYNASCPSRLVHLLERLLHQQRRQHVSAALTAKSLATLHAFGQRKVRRKGRGGADHRLAMRRSPRARTPRSTSPPSGTPPNGTCSVTAAAVRPTSARHHVRSRDKAHGHQFVGAHLRQGGLHRRDEQPQTRRHPGARERVVSDDGLRADERHDRHRELR